jgi:hypothetical protein
MKIIYNKIIPFPGFLAINLFGVLFVREEFKDMKLSNKVINHESIHTEQIKEMFYIFFYIWYFIEWFIRLFINGRKAYRMISFEQEAYDNEENLNYIKTRKKWAWRSYYGKAAKRV